MDSQRAAAIAAERFEAHRTRAPYVPSPEEVRSLPLDAAYQVQSAFNVLQVEAGVGDAVGYKIALTSKAMQDFVGVDHPLAGVVYASRVHASPATRSLSQYQHIGVEFEVTVRLAAALEAGGAPHTRDGVAAAVSTLAPSFELVEDRNADYAALNAFDLIAENSWNAGLILGDEVSGWQQVDLVDGATRLWVDSEPAGEGRVGDALGHPFDAVAWLANMLNARGESLAAGSLVMTGSSITTKFPVAGEHYRFAVDGLGEVSATWTA